MSGRSITVRLNSETAKLYDEYREKWNLEEFAEALIGQLSAEISEVKEIAGLASNQRRHQFYAQI